MSSETPAAQTRRAVQIGKFEIIKHIATGGMGAVYRARDTELKREVALKVLTPEMAAKPAMLERFKREAKHASKLRHENIVTIYEFGETSGTYYISMEFVEGIDLHEFITKKKSLDPEVSRQIMIQAARALEHAHAHSIVHRDIKPSNLLLTKKNNKVLVKLTDLGLAREVSNDEFRVTRAGTTVGTVDYISPEQARDSGTADIRSDLYSLGCTWFHMLAGRAPFPDGSLAERLCKHMMDAPPDVTDFNPVISQELVAILERLLAKSPDARYESPTELLAALHKLKAVAGACLDVSNVTLKEEETCPSASKDSADQDDDDSQCYSLTEDELPASRPAPSGAVQRYIGTRRTAPGRASKLLKSIEATGTDEPLVNKNSYLGLLVGAGIGVVVLAIIVFALSWNRGSKKPIDDTTTPVAEKKPEPTPPIIPVDIPKDVKPDDTKNGNNPAIPPVLVTKPLYPALYKPAIAVDAHQLQAKASEPWSKIAPLSDKTPIFRVARIADGGPNAYTSLTAACAAAPNEGAVIEIHDNGPLYETGAAVAGKRLVIRAGQGFRPLVVWDILRLLDDAKREKLTELRPFVFLSGQKADITLENLEMVFQWPENALPRPLTLVQNHQGDLTLRNCVFSFSDTVSKGVTLARITGSPRESLRCRISNCYARCNRLTALDVQTPQTEILIEDSLIVGDSQNLLELKAQSDRPTNLRLVRSTLICGKNLLNIQPLAALDRKPSVHVLAWDSLLSRSSPVSGGEMIALAGEAGNLKWDAVNSLYAGWAILLNSNRPIITASDVSGWQRQWVRSEGDAAKKDPWPSQLPSVLEDKPAAQFRPQDSENRFVCFASSQNTNKPLGCDVEALPPTRDNWLSLSQGYLFLPTDPLSDPGPPEIEPATGNLYAGERLVLSNLRTVDLGKYLEEKQRAQTFAPKVVIRLAGTGEHFISPFRIRKGSSLVLYVEQPEEPKQPPKTPLLTKPVEKPKPIVLKLKREDERPSTNALIEVDEGNLEMTNVEIQLPDFEHAKDLPSWVIQINNGNLQLFRCKLIGPQLHTPARYKGLVFFNGSGSTNPEKAGRCQIEESLLLSSQVGVGFRGVGQRVDFYQTAIAAGTNAVALELADFKGQANIQMVLKRVTLAGRRSCLELIGSAGIRWATEPIMLHTRECAFLAPFPVGSKSGLLLSRNQLLQNGQLIWQGIADVLDSRLQYVMAGDEAIPRTPQKPAADLVDRVWPIWRYPPKEARVPILNVPFVRTFDDKKPWPLDRLVLPGPRPGAPIDKRAGADMLLLGYHLPKRP